MSGLLLRLLLQTSFNVEGLLLLLPPLLLLLLQTGFNVEGLEFIGPCSDRTDGHAQELVDRGIILVGHRCDGLKRKEFFKGTFIVPL